MPERTSLERARDLVARVNADTVVQVAAEIEIEDQQRAALQARVGSLPALEQQRSDLHQAIGQLTNELRTAMNRKIELDGMEQRLATLDNEILSVRKLAGV